MARILEVQNLRTFMRQRRGVVRAVDGVSLHIDEGETLGLVGESGCGKTMTALSVMRLLPARGYIAGGSVRVEGRNLIELSEQDMRRVRGKSVAMIFQDPMTSLNPTMPIGQQIAETVHIHHCVDERHAIARAEEVLRLVGVPRPAERMRSYPHQLSGGLRQRCMIAMALACRPRLLIADEPTSALDVTIQAQILDLLDNIRREFNMGVLLITHDLGVIAGRADRVCVMYAGKVVEQAQTEALFAQPHHPYTEALMQSVPGPKPDRSEPLYSIPGLPPDLSQPPAGCRFHPRCRYATDECTELEPSLDGDDSSHLYASYHPRGGVRPSQAALRELAAS